MLRGLRVKAILVGIVAGFFAGAIWSIAASLVLRPLITQAGSPANALASSPTFVLISLVGAVGSALVAGWVTARMTIGAEVLNSVAVGVVIVLLSAVLFMPLGMNEWPLWYNVPAFALTVPFSLLGGVIRRNTRSGNDS